MEAPAVLATTTNGRLRHFKNAASALCRGGARTLPRRRASKAAPPQHHHHTFPKVAGPRVAVSKHLGTLFGDVPVHGAGCSEDAACHGDQEEEEFVLNTLDAYYGNQKLRGKMAREVALAWSNRIGAPDVPAPADHVQGLFNEMHLYPTKTQVFEMLVCARQCTRRKSLQLTFGEFCVFAAELRKHARRAKQTSSKPESPFKVDTSREKEGPRVVNGSEPTTPPPPCEVFLGGSCNPTTWRSEIAIPLLEEMGITYFNPQVAEWSLELVEVENRAKQAARALLFVLDSETRAVAASVEAAQLAALPRDLLLVLRPYRRGQRIGNETISDQEYAELSRARATLQEAVERRGLPAFTDIPSALHCARTVLRGARTHPRQPLGHTILRLKRAFDATRSSRARAVDAVAEFARVSRDVADAALPAGDALDFEGFCGAVAELTADNDSLVGEGEERSGRAPPTPGGVAERLRRALRTLRDRISFARSPAHDGGAANATTPEIQSDVRTCEPRPPAPANGLRRQTSKEKSKNGYEHSHNSRLKACGKKLSIFIPKNVSGGSGGGATEGDSVLTPGTERRLERLPAMLASSPAPRTPPAHTHHVYLGGSLPKSGPSVEERLRAAGLSCVVPRVNDYARMFSTPTRRAAAAAHPDSPRADKKPRTRPDEPRAERKSPRADRKCRAAPTTPTEEVQLREKENTLEPSDRLSASDFYTVTEDLTPQPFKGTYDEELLWGSRVLLFSISADAPCFSAMVLAAHYMELRPADTVLLVQNLQHSPSLSETAVKDYNRGRHYLRDLAARSGVAVFGSAAEAADAVLDKLNNTQ